MGALQPGHLILVLVIVLIIFGPGKLTSIGGELGRGIKEFRESTEGGSSKDKDVTATPTAAATVCGSCGATLAADASFCPKCGTRVAIGAKPN